jgi:hypothetical protein
VIVRQDDTLYVHFKEAFKDDFLSFYAGEGEDEEESCD